MARVNTSLEEGLKRILGLCPDIVLDPEAIQDIIDGKINKVLCEARGNTYDDSEPIPEPEPEPIPVKKPTTITEVGKTPTVVSEDKTDNEDISSAVDEANDSDFNEYFENDK